MWCSSGVFSSATMCSPWRPVKPSEEIAAVASARSHSRKAGSAQAFHHLGAVARPDLGLVGLDQNIDRRRIDIALLGQDRLEGADPKLDVGELAVFVVVVVVVVMVVHGRDSTAPLRRLSFRGSPEARARNP